MTPAGVPTTAVWTVPTAAVDVQRLLPALRPDEQRRASAFRRAVDRDRFVGGRILLRIAAAAATGMMPLEVELSAACPTCGATDHGRPVVVRRPECFLSLTHAGDVIAVATSPVPVGIDVEPYDQHLDVDELADRSCSAGERSVLAVSVGVRRVERFLDLWTLKEAFVKATGGSLDDLAAIDVLAALDAPADVRAGNVVVRCERLGLAPGHAGAVAGGGDVRTIVDGRRALAVWPAPVSG